MKMHIARDKDNGLHLFSDKPFKVIWNTGSEDFIYWDTKEYSIKIDNSLFPEVTFKNSPVEVELVIKK